MLVSSCTCTLDTCLSSKPMQDIRILTHKRWLFFVFISLHLSINFPFRYVSSPLHTYKYLCTYLVVSTNIKAVQVDKAQLSISGVVTRTLRWIPCTYHPNGITVRKFEAPKVMQARCITFILFLRIPNQDSCQSAWERRWAWIPGFNIPSWYPIVIR